MNARELLALIDDCGMIELINRSGRNDGGWIQETILRALRLLAAAEGGEAERSKLVEDLRTEADLCRNETAEDIAELLDDAASAIIAMSSQFKALKDERNGLAARVVELEKDAERYRAVRLMARIRMDLSTRGVAVFIPCDWPQSPIDTPGLFDAAIDAARSKP